MVVRWLRSAAILVVAVLGEGRRLDKSRLEDSRPLRSELARNRDG